MKNSTPTTTVIERSPRLDIEPIAWQQFGQLMRETHGVIMWAMLDSTYRPEALVR